MLIEEIDYGQSNRRDEYRFMLVDPFSLAELEEIKVDASSSSLNSSYYSDNKVQGTISLQNDDYRREGKDKMIRIYHKIIIGNYTEENALATLFVDSASVTHDRKLVTGDLNCYSTLWRYTGDVLMEEFYRQKGQNVIDEIRFLVEQDGGHMRTEHGLDFGKTHTRDIMFDMGENKMDVINTIAGWIDATVDVDPYGYIVLKPYYTPSEKGVSYTFQSGMNCTYISGLTITDNRSEMVNRVKAFYSRETKEDGDTMPFSDAVMVDLPASSPFSYERCGRRRGYVLEVTEPCSRRDLERKANNYLEENSVGNEYITIEHVGLPFLQKGDVVRYINDVDFDYTYDVNAMIEEMSIPSFNPGCITQSTLKIVRHNT